MSVKASASLLPKIAQTRSNIRGELRRYSSTADRLTPLEAEDLHRLAWSAGLAGHDDAMLATQERVYHARLAAGEDLSAARAAFWLGFRLLARGHLLLSLLEQLRLAPGGDNRPGWGRPRKHIRLRSGPG